ncbi:MAG: GcrA family cell cycle regulator [Parvularculaceae bacterium]
MAWTDERVELLKKLWSEGLSASQIATKMGGVTRNAVIGKVHRLGLSGRATPAKPQRGCAASLGGGFAEPESYAEDLEPVVPEPTFVAPTSLAELGGAAVTSLNKRMCKWPIGDPTSDDFRFCGEPTLAGKSYCAYHAQLAFQPTQRRQPEPAAEPRRIELAAPAQRRAAS